MNTQNVKTAAPESTERCGQTTSLRMDGFISDISSSHPFDVVRAGVVISSLERKAQAGCGLYWEIFEFLLIRSLLDHLCRLPVKDRAVFIGAIVLRDITFTWAEVDRIQTAYREVMAEIAAERE